MEAEHVGSGVNHLLCLMAVRHECHREHAHVACHTDRCHFAVIRCALLLESLSELSVDERDCGGVDDTRKAASSNRVEVVVELHRWITREKTE